MLKPRYVCFIEDGVEVGKHKAVKIDIDKLIAKYDFDIAQTLMPDNL